MNTSINPVMYQGAEQTLVKEESIYLSHKKVYSNTIGTFKLINDLYH